MTTLPEYLKECGADDELASIISLIGAQAAPIRDAFISNQNYADSTNSSGETQAEMDTWSDTHITNVLAASGLVREVASEERDDIVKLSESAKYSVVMDPLDGSSLIKVNRRVGKETHALRTAETEAPAEEPAAELFSEHQAGHFTEL